MTKDALSVYYKYASHSNEQGYIAKKLKNAENIEMSFYTKVQQENKRVLDKVKATKGQLFHVANYGEPGYRQGWLDKQNFSKVNLLSCLFPRKIVITSAYRQGDVETLRELLHGCYSILDCDLAELYVDLDHRLLRWTPQLDRPGTPETLKNDSIHLLTNDFRDIKYEEQIQVLLPWLYNARPGDYIELLEKYKLQFEIYNNHIDKIADVAKDVESLTSLLVKEVKDAFMDIRIVLEEKKEELRRKGITTILGVILTSIPLLFPQGISFMSPELLTGLFGAATLAGTVPPLVNAVRDVSKAGEKNPYWIIWKWSEIEYEQEG